MSFAALAWASKQNVGRASDKLILLAYADRHNEETGCAYPSVAALCEFSCLDRKTVIASVARLEALGLLTETGDRAGNTKQIKVYRVNIETVAKLEPSQKRNSSEIPTKQSQKRDTEPVREPISSEAKASSDKRAKPSKFEFACPEGVDPMDWSALIDNRKAKRAALSEGAHRQIITKLETWSRAGWPPGPIVAHAAERGWTTVFETDEMKGPRNGSGSRPVQQAPDGRAMGRTESAAHQALANLTGGGNRGTGGQAGPALAGGDHGGTRALPHPDRPYRHVG